MENKFPFRPSQITFWFVELFKQARQLGIIQDKNSSAISSIDNESPHAAHR
jgi:hypothetical protein